MSNQSWDADEGNDPGFLRPRTHYVGDGCQPPHGDVFDGTTGTFKPFEEVHGLPQMHTTEGMLFKTLGGSVMPFEDASLAQQMIGRSIAESFNEQARRQDLEAAAETLLGGIVPGWTKDNDHSRNTPARFVKMLRQLCEPVDEWNFTTFPAKTDNMVVLGPIPFYTLCAHHVVPFHGTAFVGYVPDRTVAGLSKFARAVRAVAKGLHVQEELTTDIADFLEEKLEPKGLAVVLKAEHMCMAMRGVEVAGVITTTAEMRGVFSDHDRTAKAEFLQWIRHA